jgi:hypothetical protein
MNLAPFDHVARAGVYYLAGGELPDTVANVLPVSLNGLKTLRGALRRLGAQLEFPDWYGGNLDALNDCLSDPDWLGAQGKVVLIRGLASLQEADPEGCATLLEVFLAAADDCRGSGSPLWILLDHPADGIARLPSA